MDNIITVSWPDFTCFNLKQLLLERPLAKTINQFAYLNLIYPISNQNELKMDNINSSMCIEEFLDSPMTE